MTATLSNSAKKRLLKSYSFIVQAIGFTTIVVSILVLFGWVYDVAVLKSVIPKANTMKVNTALGFLFSGLSILLYLAPSDFIRSKKIVALLGVICAGLTCLIGLLTLSEHMFNHDYGIDEVLIPSEPDWRSHSPGRMSLMSAFCFSLLGLNLLFGSSCNPIIQGMIKFTALFVLGIASLALLGYVYHPGALFHLSFMSEISVHAALLFAMLSFAILLARPLQQSAAWHYSLAAIIVVLAFGLRLQLIAWFGPDIPIFLLFFPGIIFVALLTGFGPGLFTTVISVMVVAIWIYEPVGYLSIDTPVNKVSLLIFCGTGGLLCAVIRLYHRNQEKAANFDRDQEFREMRKEALFLGGILDSSSQPFAVGYPDGRLGLNNHAYQELTGYSATELEQLDWNNILTPVEWRAFEEEKIAELIRTSKPIRYEKEYIRKDGSRIPVELFVHLVRNEQGQPDYFYSFFSDITARKHAETALRESENRFRQVTECLPQLVWTCRADGSCDYLSPQWCIYTGIPEAPQLGIGWLEQLHPDDRERTISTWKATAAQGGNLTIEFRIRRYDGEYRWFHTLAAPLRDESGGIVKWFGSNTEIQELKEADLALRESEARLHFALEMCNTGAWEVDLETHAGYRSIEHARIFGYANLESPWSMKLFLEHVVEEDRPRIAALVNEAIRTGNELHFECRIRRIDGEIRWVMGAGRFHATKLDGKKQVAVGIIQDITERKHAQIALELLNNELEERVKKRTDELATLNQSLETFVYSVSHDLKTPLRGIDGYCRLLLEDFKDKLEGEGQLFLKHIREGIHRMNELIDDLLAYSRMSSRNLDEVSVDIAQLLENILQENDAEINKRSVKIDIKLPISNVHADKEGLALVLRNLLGNALKFSTQTPEPHICICADQDESTVRLCIKDNGIGFDMKYVDRIFEIFQRLHRLEDYPGTGIGLALVKTAMQRMGGKVWAESQPGQGATFYIELKK